MSDKITIIKGKVEEVSLPVDKVDIIISEWMGYFLLYESMLDTVLFARDKWLTKDGILFPDRCVLKVAMAEDGAYRNEKTSFWDNVYDADMSCIKTWVMQEPCVDVLNKEQVVSTASTILDIDLQTVTKEELDFTSSFQVEMTHNSDAHAIVSWFDCFFSHSHNDIVLSTSIHP